MKLSKENQIKGTVHEVKGTVKEKAVKVTNNTDLQTDGHDERLARKVQKKLWQVEKVLER